MRFFLALGLLIALCAFSVRRRCITRGTVSLFVPAKAGATHRLRRR